MHGALAAARVSLRCCISSDSMIVNFSRDVPAPTSRSHYDKSLDVRAMDVLSKLYETRDDMRQGGSNVNHKLVRNVLGVKHIV